MGPLVLVLAAALAQPPQEVTALNPYVLRFLNNPDPVRVLLDENDLGGISFMVLYDEPWSRNPRWERVQRSQLEADGGVVPEESALREHWLDGEWPKHGGVKATTRSGGIVWVLEDDKEWAERARALARAAYASPADEPSVPELPDAESREGPGVVQMWAPHAAVVSIAAVLAAAVYLLALRKRARWQSLESGNQSPRKR